MEIQLNQSLQAQKAAMWIVEHPFSMSDAELKHKEQLYNIVCLEHQRLISKIQVPFSIQPKRICLSLKEIFFLEYLHGKPVQKPSIAVYWFMEHHIYDYQQKVQLYFDGGFLTALSAFNSIEFLTVRELKEIAKSFGFPSSGSKSALVTRIRQNIGKEQIDTMPLAFSRFCLTDHGRAVVSKHVAAIVFRKDRMHLSPYLNAKIVAKFATINPGLSRTEYRDAFKKMSWLLDKAQKLDKKLIDDYLSSKRIK